MQSVREIIRQALKEDSYRNDVTTMGLVLGNFKVKAIIKAKENGVCAGINIAQEVFKTVDNTVKFKVNKKDGDRFKAKDVIATIYGQAKSILTAERTALNFLSRLSGIATLTRQFVEEVKPAPRPKRRGITRSGVKPCKVKILDTRKTTPGLRLLEKYAVRMGGGYNHRYDLSDGVLIKDNHIACLKKKTKKISWGSVIKKFRKETKSKLLEIEIISTKEFKEVIKYAPDIIMLDNMDKAQIKECVKMRNSTNKKIQLEISGNVNLGNVKKLASLGVERISIGSLTHSSKAVDMSLEFTP